MFTIFSASLEEHGSRRMSASAKRVAGFVGSVPVSLGVGGVWMLSAVSWVMMRLVPVIFYMVAGLRSWEEEEERGQKMARLLVLSRER